MDALFKSMSLGFILRSGFAGIFFVLAYRIAAVGPNAFLDCEFKDVSTTVSLSLVAGVAVYSLHRALIYPLLEYLLDTQKARQLRERFPLISNATISALLKVWALSADKDNVAQQYASRTSTWGDFTHMLYASSLCLGAGSLAKVTMHPGSYTVCLPLVGLGILLALAGAVSDWRLNRIYDHLRQPA